MALEIVFAPRARQDIEEILDFIHVDDERAALRMLQRFEKTAGLLAERPYIGSPAPVTGHAQMRKLSLPPYMIFYRIREPQLEIARILHSSRDADLSTLFGT